MPSTHLLPREVDPSAPLRTPAAPYPTSTGVGHRCATLTAEGIACDCGATFDTTFALEVHQHRERASVRCGHGVAMSDRCARCRRPGWRHMAS